MSTIVGTNIEVTNIKFDSDTTSMIISNTGQITAQGEGTATTNLQQGLAKAWFNLNASPVTARDSFNIASFTDEATGSYEGNFTNAMNDGNYSAVGTCSTKGVVNAYQYIVTTGDETNTYGLHSTAGIRANCYVTASTNALSDTGMVQLNLNGDLA
tara:strand:- start:437 stop:904 length:468 start_codon:yes stop_codon:yes gene_type:complete